MALSRFHLRFALSVGLFGVLGSAFCGCTNGTGPASTTTTGKFVTSGTTPFVNTNNSSRAACQANTHVSGRARWTVLVYLNAASNLQPDSLINVAQMASVGSNANLNIIVQWKQTATQNFFTGVSLNTTPSFIGTRRYKISKHSQADLNKIAPPNVNTNPSVVGDTTVLDPDRLADPPANINSINDAGNTTADMGDYHTLADFVQWGTKNYPADYIALVIWDHGSGALSVDNRSARRSWRSISGKKAPTRGLSQDVLTGSQIATQELPLALANPAQPIDALIVDCSLQGTTEVAYDVRKSARVYVASEESPPGTGYPYDVWLTFLQNNTATACDCGQNLITETLAAYPNETNVTQSMTDLSKMDAVASALNTFGNILRAYATPLSGQIFTVRQATQGFEFPEYKDLYDFADRIRTISTVPTDLGTAAGNVETSLLGSGGAILASVHSTVSSGTMVREARASGLSIFLPGPQTQSSVDGTTGFDPAWLQLGIAQAAPHWADFLQAQVQ